MDGHEHMQMISSDDAMQRRCMFVNAVPAPQAPSDKVKRTSLTLGNASVNATWRAKPSCSSEASFLARAMGLLPSRAARMLATRVLEACRGALGRPKPSNTLKASKATSGPAGMARLSTLHTWETSICAILCGMGDDGLSSVAQHEGCDLPQATVDREPHRRTVGRQLDGFAAVCREGPSGNAEGAVSAIEGTSSGAAGAAFGPSIGSGRVKTATKGAAAWLAGVAFACGGRSLGEGGVLIGTEGAGRCWAWASGGTKGDSVAAEGAAAAPGRAAWATGGISAGAEGVSKGSEGDTFGIDGAAFGTEAGLSGLEGACSTRVTIGEATTRVPGVEAAVFSLAAGLTAACLAQEPAFSDLALSGAADAIPEEAAALWEADSAFSHGVDAFTCVGVARRAGGTTGAEAGTTGSDA
ncbi:MAG: hypothetical protein FRX49_05374 [Trebouxia sp. A1-2]|nr:MAG: hypothetical protein FRX49_05374 [Trebouxia sp. A1-2]